MQEGQDVLLLEFSYNISPQNEIHRLLAQWIVALQDLCSTQKVLASRIVSRWGLGYSLCKMCCCEDIIQKACVGIKLFEDIPNLFSDQLYQVILVIDLRHKENILKQFNRHNCKAQVIGQTGGDVIANHHICWPLDQIRKAYESTWNFKTV